jgi:hypothetical protein
MLSAAFVAYVQDQRHDPNVGIVYVDPELKPTPPSAHEILSQAAQARSLSDYIGQMGWMNPIYANLARRSQAACTGATRSAGCSWPTSSAPAHCRAAMAGM